MNLDEKVVIRLSATAMDSLFPEGTEARVQLQNAVLQQAAKQYVKGAVTNEIRTELTKIAHEIVTDLNLNRIVEEHFTCAYNWEKGLKVRGDSSMTRAIAEHIKDSITASHRKLIEDTVSLELSATVAGLQGLISSKVTSTLVYETEQRIRTRVRAALDEAADRIVGK